MNNYKINSAQAIDLEIKLNLSTYSKIWRGLGQRLYEWRLSPIYYELSVSNTYSITAEQMMWIKSNIKNIDDDYHPFTLIVIE